MNKCTSRIGKVLTVTLLWLQQTTTVLAGAFGGGTVESGLAASNTIKTGSASNDIGTSVVGLLGEVLGYMAFAAVIVIIIVGIYLVVGLGNEDSQQRARKVILYVIAGLLIILSARGIVERIISSSLTN